MHTQASLWQEGIINARSSRKGRTADWVAADKRGQGTCIHPSCDAKMTAIGGNSSSFSNETPRRACEHQNSSPSCVHRLLEIVCWPKVLRQHRTDQKAGQVRIQKNDMLHAYTSCQGTFCLEMQRTNSPPVPREESRHVVSWYKVASTTVLSSRTPSSAGLLLLHNITGAAQHKSLCLMRVAWVCLHDTMTGKHRQTTPACCPES
jgi:hypothetical protein